MGKYSEFGRRLDELARTAFSVLERAEHDFSLAQADREAHPLRPGSIGATSEAQREAMQYELNFQAAKERFEKARAAFSDNLRKARELRTKLLEQLEADLSVNPADLDASVATILNSGLCTPAEVRKLFEGSESPTTKRLIAQFAKNAAGGENLPVADKAIYEMIASDGQKLFPENSDALRAFDFGLNVLARCEKNHDMSAYWGALTEQPLSEM